MVARGRSRPSEGRSVDRFLMVHSDRTDGWRELASLAARWAGGQATRSEVERALAAMQPVEEYFAYPGPRLLAALAERVAGEDAPGTEQFVPRIGNAIPTRSFEARGADREAREEAAGELAELLPPTPAESGGRRP